MVSLKNNILLQTIKIKVFICTEAIDRQTAVLQCPLHINISHKHTVAGKNYYK